MQTRTIEMKLNGKICSRTVPANQTLASLLREGFGLSTSIACGEGNCGTCSVLLDGQPIRSCLMLAVQASGRAVTTLEGLEDELPRLQKAFSENHAIQCGFCAPGFMIAAASLLRRCSKPSEAEIREAIKGHLCRCSGYSGFVSAILQAAQDETAKEPAGQEEAPQSRA
jgi:aerobic-type carbon monoxide dehydrogenase small subunit (CoxS/CutS family)